MFDSTTATAHDFSKLPGEMTVYRAEEERALKIAIEARFSRPPSKRAPVAKRIGWNGKREVLHPTKGWRRG